MKPREIANELEHMLNNMCSEESEAEFVDAVMQFHRTLQQKAMGLIVAIIVRWARCAGTGDYDLRNEATVRLAMSIVEHLASTDQIYKGKAALPFI